MNNINNIQDQMIEDFSVLEGDLEMANIYIIELGEQLQELDETHMIDANLVKGCQAKVWLVTDFEDGKVIYQADSNAHITKGLISLLIRVLSNQTPEDIINADLYFIEKIGLNRYIGTQRSNGFAAMIKQMKLYGLAYQNKVASN